MGRGRLPTGADGPVRDTGQPIGDTSQPIGSGMSSTSYPASILSPVAGFVMTTRQARANWSTEPSIGMVPEMSTVPSRASPRSVSLSIQ